MGQNAALLNVEADYTYICHWSLNTETMETELLVVIRLSPSGFWHSVIWQMIYLLCIKYATA
jgi:hypothetical protein